MEADGVLKKQKKDRSSFPQFYKFPVVTKEDWERLKPLLDPDNPERYRKYEAEKGSYVREDHVMRYGICGCYGFVRGLFGEENLAYAYYDCPDVLTDMMKVWLKLYKGVADRIFKDNKFDYVFIWEDMAYKTAPLISPEHFKEFMLPYYKEFTSYMRSKHGVDIFCVDSDGNNFAIMDLFVEGGVNMFLPCEIAAGMEPEQIREKYPKLVIYGGIDKREIAKGKEHIEKEIDRKVPKLMKLGGYFPAMDHHIPPDISLDNFRYYLEYIRKIKV